MSKFYAGIGSRKTPDDVLSLMTQIAYALRNKGYTLRSGGANGADLAFERGVGDEKEIYLPWRGFNGSTSPLFTIGQDALDMAAQFHPAWNHCTPAARKLHARNCYQILGADLKTPSKFVMCWHDGSGGTTQACRIAEHHGIPVHNLREGATRLRIIHQLGLSAPTGV